MLAYILPLEEGNTLYIQPKSPHTLWINFKSKCENNVFETGLLASHIRGHWYKLLFFNQEYFMPSSVEN